MKPNIQNKHNPISKINLKTIVKLKYPSTKDIHTNLVTVNNKSTLDHSTLSSNKQNKSSKLNNKSKSPNKIKGISSRSLVKTNGINSYSIPKVSDKTELSNDINYTLFTSKEPSGSLVCCDKPIQGKLINTSFISEKDLYDYSYSLIKDSNILLFDKVYNETVKIENIFQEQLKTNVSGLFQGLSTCFLLFGPIEGGKSFSLRGGESNQEKGMLSKTVSEILNLIEISKQANFNKKNETKISYNLKLSCYQVFNEAIHDLLSKEYNKDMKILNSNSTSENITKKEIFSSKDLDLCLKEIIQLRKLLTQSLRVNDLKRKSSVVFSLILEKKESSFTGVNNKTKTLNNLNNNKNTGRNLLSTEQNIVNFSQLDFVELPSSNYGLQSENEKSDIFKSVSKTFNSIVNNIVALSNNNQPKLESKLTLSLKKSLCPGSSIFFMTCANPIETPLSDSFQALKFTNWMRNQVVNLSPNPEFPLAVNSDNKKPYVNVQSSNNADFNNFNFNVDDEDNNNKLGLMRMDRYYNAGNNNNVEENEYQVSNNDSNTLKFNNSNTNTTNNNTNVNGVYSAKHMFNSNAPLNNNTNNNNMNKDSNLNYNANNRNLYNTKKINNQEYQDSIQFNDMNNNISKNSHMNLNTSVNNDINNENKVRFTNATKENFIQADESRGKNNYYRKIKTYSDQPTNDTKENNFENTINSQNTFHTNNDTNNRSRTMNNNDTLHNSNSFSNINRNINNNLDSNVNMNQNNNNNLNIDFLEQQLSEIERTKKEVAKYLDTIRAHKGNLDSKSSSNYEISKLIQENQTLKSDNIIFREDISRLSELNQRLEDDLVRQRNRNLELANDLESVHHEKLQYKNEIERLNESNSKTKTQEINQSDLINIRYLQETKIKELESENKAISNDKQKLEVEFRVIQERHTELKKAYEIESQENKFMRIKHNEEISNIESKFDKMSKQIESLNYENSNLRMNEEKLRIENINLDKQKESFREKYQDYKNRYKMMSSKLVDLEGEFRNFLYQKDQESYEKRKDEEIKKQRIDSKQKILEDFQSKINGYKCQLMMNRNKNEEN